MHDDGIKIQAPIKVEIKVIVCDDEGNSGEVTFEMPAMRYPSKEEIDAAIEEVANSEVLAKNSMRVATKRETFDYMIRERTGCDERFAMPGDQTEWDV